MRLKPVRWLVGAGIATVIASVLTVFTPTPAHAGDCYTVYVGSNGTTICPWD